MQPTTPTAALPPRRYDNALWNQLRSIDLRLLDELAFLSRKQRQRSPSGATYCCPGRAYLARKLDCSIETISDHISHLAQLGLIHRVQRRPHAGRFQTTLYRLIHPMAWAAARVRQLVLRTAHRVPIKTHIASVQKNRDSIPRQKESLRDIIARGLAKFAAT